MDKSKATVQKNKNQNKKMKSRSKKTKALRSRGGVQLTPCAKDFLQALTDPFGYRITGRDVCIPDNNSTPSLKYNVTQRGTFTIGTAGVGYVLFAPTIAVNNINSFCYTGSTFTGTTIAASGTGVTAASIGQFPFDNVSDRDHRVVAAGVRARYIGPELNRAGSITPFYLVGVNDEAVGMSQVNLVTRPEILTFPNNRQWCGSIYRHNRADSYEYRPHDAAITLTTGGTLGVMVQGATAGTSWEFEFVSYVESVSRSGTAVFGQTASHSDIVGLSMVKDFVGHISASEAGQSLYNKGLEFLRSAALGAVSSYVGAPLPALEWKAGL